MGSIKFSTTKRFSHQNELHSNQQNGDCQRRESHNNLANSSENLGLKRSATDLFSHQNELHSNQHNGDLNGNVTVDIRHKINSYDRLGSNRDVIVVADLFIEP